MNIVRMNSGEKGDVSPVNFMNTCPALYLYIHCNKVREDPWVCFDGRKAITTNDFALMPLTLHNTLSSRFSMGLL